MQSLTLQRCRLVRGEVLLASHEMEGDRYEVADEHDPSGTSDGKHFLAGLQMSRTQ